MNKYNVTLQAAINVRVSAVEAATPQEAIQAAIDKIDLYSLLERQKPTPKVDFTEYAEEVREALVDVAGDEEYEESRWFIWHNGQWVPMPADRIEELRLLDHQAKTLREELGYSQPGEVVWQARLDFNELLVVVADGYSRASVLRVSGNYPVEYLLKERKDFDNEHAACASAGKQAAKTQT
jgi:transposase